MRELKIMSSTSRKSDIIFTKHRDGSVTVRGHDFTEHLRPWGHPQGFGCTGSHREHYNGEQRPVFLTSAIRIHGASDRVTRGSAPCIDRIALSVPLEIRQSIYHLLHWPIELIQIAECEPQAFLRLVKRNPALACVIARQAAIQPLWDARYWGNHLLGRKENDITRQLSLGSNCAGFLRKIRDETLCSHGYLDLALSAWKRPGMARLLQHVRRVNLDVVTVAFNLWAIVRECPSLLHIAAANQNVYSTEVYETVEHVSQIRRSLRKPTWPWRKIRDLEHLRKLRLRAEREALAQGKLADVVYPPPPVSPCSDWQWVSCLSELQEVGERYQNCAESYHWRCLSGDVALYVSRRTSWEDTVIVTLCQLRGSNRWEVTDVLGPNNALVDEEEAIAVRRHFEEALKGGDQ